MSGKRQPKITPTGVETLHLDFHQLILILFVDVLEFCKVVFQCLHLIFERAQFSPDVSVLETIGNQLPDDKDQNLNSPYLGLHFCLPLLLQVVLYVKLSPRLCSFLHVHGIDLHLCGFNLLA